MLDCELNFNHHVKELKKNLGFKSYMLAILKSYVPTVIMLIIYKTYVLPLFDYADVLYNGATGTQLLQTVQNRCLKYCLKVPILATSKQKLKPEPVQIEKPVPPQYVPPRLPYDVFKNDWDLSDDDQTPENLGHSCFNKRSFKLTTKA